MFSSLFNFGPLEYSFLNLLKCNTDAALNEPVPWRPSLRNVTARRGVAYELGLVLQNSKSQETRYHRGKAASAPDLELYKIAPRQAAGPENTHFCPVLR